MCTHLHVDHVGWNTRFAPPTDGWVVDAEKAWRFELTPPADTSKP